MVIETNLSTLRYIGNQYLIESLLAGIISIKTAIPEKQGPFLWDSTKVQALIYLLYQGYSVGYLLTWKNPSFMLDNDSLFEWKKILIDRQQKVTALLISNPVNLRPCM